MHIEELKKLEAKGMELMRILNENKIEFKYDSAYGGYIIYEGEDEIICKDENELEDYIEDYLVVTIDECYSCGNTLDIKYV